ncbi:hypothetical protein CH373_06590 [Leptospira perolatii]|uniref:Uncharacterized protein n=1 Tax=Leptospira perolatii TaxID=2023191 RepID=A0A2M9ZP98_9LEPT|nr:ankyrin repeat domain-containing protein [Leptospira perolatii]PJZ70609.1 hypothetical protein CH360_03450 [Leptospira perolatii]PJZ73821.1 hypothetical protein CH373_06590 [Leptospira perolatii]
MYDRFKCSLFFCTWIAFSGVFLFNCSFGLPQLRDKSILDLSAAEKLEAEKQLLMIKAGGADIDRPIDSQGDTQLFRAAAEGRFAVVKLLLENGADPNLANSRGITPLMAAASQGRLVAWKKDGFKVVYLLLREGAKINDRDQEKNTALMYAASSGDHRAVGVLLLAGANTSLKNRYELSALAMADRIGYDGGNAAGMLNQFSTMKVTPLIWSSYFDSNFALILLAMGANPNDRHSLGGTALHLASMAGHTELVRKLISAGANVNAKDDNGDTPMKAALLKNHTEIVLILKNAGGK